MKQGILITLTVVLFGVGSLLAQSRSAADPYNQPLARGGGASTVSTTLPPDAAQQQLVEQNLKDVHFDFDRADLRPDDRSSLETDARWLKDHPDVIITIAGDADERGEIVYNLVLSDERATTVKDALVALGVPADQIVHSVGWGKLYPVCSESDEGCWSQNRRAHFNAW
ncbi:MAG TPA: OmpA family protein [Terriglobales bacterium]|nr:OmpA family protein [Terriglobales bacterium]